MWISALRDYSKVRADIESNVSGISSGTSDSASALEMYVLATRELIMPYYKMSWVSVLRAVTSLITSHEDLLLPIIGCAEEQSKIFYSIFGLCIEAISTSGIGAASSTKQDTNGFINILESLKCILGRKVLGDSFVSSVRNLLM